MNTINKNLLYKQIFALFILCFAQMSYLFSQTVNLNHKGEKIVVYNDGSWRYFDEDDEEDQKLYLESDIYEDDKKEKKDKVKKAKTAKVEKPKKEKTVKADKSKSKKTKTPKSKSKKASAYAKSDKPKKKKIKESGEPSSSKEKSLANDLNLEQKVKKEIISIRDKQTVALEKERVANFALNKYERDLKSAKRRKLDKEKVGRIEAKYKEAKLQLKSARTQNKILLKQRRAYEAIQKKGVAGIAKGYAKLDRKYDTNFKVDPPKKSESLAIREKKKTKDKLSKSKKDTAETNVDDADQEDIVESIPSAYAVQYPSTKPNISKASLPDCTFAFQGKDDFSGKKRTDLQSGLLFSYTSDKMRRYFEDGDMITCEAYLSGLSGGYKFICVEVTVASETAQKSYGSIEKQALLSLRLVDGTSISLYNNKTDYGFLDPIKKTVLYKAQYLIPNEHVKTLSKVDMDKVRLVWSTGYEDYTIYETDFLINQLNCLDQ